MINKISPRPSLLKRGKEKAKMTHSITQRAKKFNPPYRSNRRNKGDGFSLLIFKGKREGRINTTMIKNYLNNVKYFLYQSTANSIPKSKFYITI